MVKLVSNSSLSVVLFNHRDISVISKSGYLTVIRRTGIMIDHGVTVFVQTMRFALLSQRSHLNDFIRCFCLFWHIFPNLSWLACCCLIPIVLACENSRTSSRPARVAFREKDTSFSRNSARAGSEERRLFSQAIIVQTINDIWYFPDRSRPSSNQFSVHNQFVHTTHKC